MHAEDGCEYFASQAQMPAEACELLDRLAYELGQAYDAYLVTEPDREYFWAPGRRGVVGFTRWGRQTYVAGGLLALPADQEDLLVRFLKFAAANRLKVSFYGIGRDQLDLFRRHGCEITKFGEEPFIPLAATNWSGKPYEWLRRQENYCIRQQVRVIEVNPDPDDPQYRDSIAPELAEISQEHLAGTVHGKELRFFVGRFDPLALGRRRLFVAEREGWIEAFVVCNPCLAGNVWAIEIYRHRADATRGVVPFAILQILRQLKDEGVAYASLSLIPCLRCDRGVRDDCRWFRYMTMVWWRCLNWIFDMRGIYHFKSRFRPDYREMYVAASPRMTVASMVGFALTWKVFEVRPGRLLAHAFRKWRKTPARGTLAQPHWRPPRVIRDVRPAAARSKPVPAPASARPLSELPSGAPMS